MALLSSNTCDLTPILGLGEAYQNFYRASFSPVKSWTSHVNFSNFGFTDYLGPGRSIIGMVRREGDSLIKSVGIMQSF